MRRVQGQMRSKRWWRDWDMLREFKTHNVFNEVWSEFLIRDMLRTNHLVFGK